MRLLKNPHTLSLLGLCLLAALALLFGDLIGLDSQRARFLAAGSLVAIWVFTGLLRFVSHIKSGTSFERLFRAQFDKAVIAATPEQRGEVALLRKQLLEAISTIKKSHLGHTRGKAALYELPWYMIIGHPAAGKSSLIQHSELSFPIAEKGTGAVRGVGGTRNCDWFFSTEGILLDTAGRYATQKEDHAEWLELLKLLKSHRSRTPINGILVTISLPELVQYRSEGFSEYARQIRARVAEIDQAFERKVPIYLLITKLDLLGGFRQFFDHLPAENRHQVWGATFNVDARGGGDREGVAREFDLLVDGLINTGITHLNNQGRGIENPALFSFPIEFRSLKGALDRFIELIFDDDPYHTKPLLRGFYFTSALQDGMPRIPAGERVSRRFELTRSGFPSERLRDSTPYFVRDLFKSVIFPDQHLIAHQMRNTLSKARWGAAIAGFVTLTLSLSAWSLSYLNNYRLTNSSLQELQLFDTDDLLDRMTRISFIQARIEQLASFSMSRPLQLQLGLYKGDEVSKELTRIYTEEAAAQIVEPLKATLEQQLTAMSSQEQVSDRSSKQTEKFYDLLKTYLMLGDKQRVDTSYLSRQLHLHWAPTVKALHKGKNLETLSPYIDQMIAFYTKNIDQPFAPIIKIDDGLVQRARTTLTSAMHQLPASERTFNEIIEAANQKYHAIGVTELLGGTNSDLVQGNHIVSGAYTRAAWEGYIRDAIETASRGSLQESDWVIATTNANPTVSSEEIDSNRQYLLARYKSEYAHTWKLFLKELSLSRFSSINDAITKLDRLSDFKQSPISRLLSGISQQTAWDNPKLQLISGREEPKDIKAAIVNRLLPDTSSASSSDPSMQYGSLEGQFQLLRQLTSDQGSTTLMQYCASLTKVKLRLESIISSGDSGKSARSLLRATNDSRSELAEATLLIDSPLLAGAPNDMKASLRRFLSQPLGYSYAAVIPLASIDINQRWQRQIYPEWQALAQKYPFSNSEGDATIDEINAFLGEDIGKLDGFINGELQGLLAHNRNRLAPRQWAGMSLAFNRDFLSQLKQTMDLRDSILRTSGPGRFELQPVPSPGLSEVILEIDGQPQRYRNGPQLWSTVIWPGEEAKQGAKITITTFSGRSVTIENFPGRLGWARLAAKASRRVVNSSTTQLTWIAPNPDHSEGQPIAIRFNVRPISGTDPMALNQLSAITFPSSVVR